MNNINEIIDFNLNKIYNSEDSEKFPITDFENPIGKKLHLKDRAENYVDDFLVENELVKRRGYFCSITIKGVEIVESGGWLIYISNEKQNISSNSIRIENGIKKYQIFISSTFTDLLEERQAAVEAILKKGHIPAAMELFTAGNKTQWEVIKKWIDESDIYLLILGGRYGTINNETGLSYIEMEYNYAVENGKPYFALSLSDEILDKKPIEIIKDYDLKNPKYINFKKEIISKKMCAFPKNIDQIKSEINYSLDTLIIENKEKMQGWIKGTI